MDCPVCGNKTKSIRKRIKRDASIGSTTSIVEILAIVLFISAFVYPAFQEHMGLVIVIAILLTLYGHSLRYKRVSLEYCKSCKKEFPIDES